MTRTPDYILDIGGMDGGRGAVRDLKIPRRAQDRPWLAVHWLCCQVYSRIYRNRAGTAYTGHCPRCAKPVRARIGSDGVNTRFFEAY